MSPVFAPATDQADIELPEPGRYIAKCVAIEDAPDKGFGAGVKWVFKLIDPGSGITIQSRNGGDYELWQFTSTKLGPKSKARPIIEALQGKPLANGEVPDSRKLLGRSMVTLVIHEKREDGSDKASVTSCKPFSEQAAGGAVAAPRTASSVNGSGGLLAQARQAVRKAEILGTPKHLDWLALDLDGMTDADLYQTIQEINEDIQAA